MGMVWQERAALAFAAYGAATGVGSFVGTHEPVALLGVASSVFAARWVTLAASYRQTAESMIEVNKDLLAGGRRLMTLMSCVAGNKVAYVLPCLKITSGGHMDSTRPPVMSRTIEN